MRRDGNSRLRRRPEKWHRQSPSDSDGSNLPGMGDDKGTEHDHAERISLGRTT